MDSRYFSVNVSVLSRFVCFVLFCFVLFVFVFVCLFVCFLFAFLRNTTFFLNL